MSNELFFSLSLSPWIFFFFTGLVLAPATSSAGASGKHSSGNTLLQNAYIARGLLHHWCRFIVFIVYNIHQIHRPQLRYGISMVVCCSGLLHHRRQLFQFTICMMCFDHDSFFCVCVCVCQTLSKYRNEKSNTLKRK